MKSTGIVFKSRDYIGSAEPSSTTLEDESRFGNDGTFLAADNPDYVQLPSGLWVMSFDGSDYIKWTIANWRSVDYAGSIKLWFKTSGENPWLFASSDEGSSSRYLGFLVNATLLTATQRNAEPTSDVLSGTTAVNDNVWHLGILTSSGTAYKIYLDGVDEGTLTVVGGANSGDWFADTALRDNFSIGAAVRDSVVGHLTGSLGLPVVYNYTLSAGQIKNILESERHWFGV